MSTTPTSKSFFGKIIDFFKKLFGSEQTTSDNSEVTQNTSQPPIVQPQIQPNNDKTKPDIENQQPTSEAPPVPHLDDITLKYGDRFIKLNKSERYIAVKPKGDIAFMDSTISRSVRNVKVGGRKMGTFEIMETSSSTMRDTEDALDKARSLPAVESGSHVYHISEREIPVVPSGELYVIFKEDANLEDCSALLETYALIVKEQRSEREFVLSITKDSPNPIKVTIALQKSPLIKTAEPDLESPIGLYAFQMPSDELLKDQWHLQNLGQHGDWPTNSFVKGADAKVIDAWKYLDSLGSSSITVAVIDSGFDIQHPDLRGNGQKIVAPYDFEGDTPDPSPKTGDWHGTSCAGVAVGAANGIGIVGAAPNAKLMPLRFSYISDSQIEKWFEHCSKNGADVVSNSWGSADPNFVMSTRMIEAIKKCATQGRNGKGCVIVFAAGNTNRTIANPTDAKAIGGFPTHPNIIAVSASNSRDERSNYSNYGPQISVCAPSNGSGGAGVTTSDVTGTLVLPSGSIGYKGYDAGDYTTSFGGTSSACPLVAGICALILSANPNLTAAQVKEVLQTTTDKIGNASDYSLQGHSIYYGYGRVNALKAVQKAKTGQISSGSNTSNNNSSSNNNNTTNNNTSTGGGAHGGNAGNNNNSGTGNNNNNNTSNNSGNNTNSGSGGSGGGSIPPLPDTSVVLPFEGLRGGAIVGTGNAHFFKITIAKQLQVTLDAPVSEIGTDFDLYVRKGLVPDPKNKLYDYASAEQGVDEKIVINNPGQGVFYLLLRVYKGAGGYNLDATLPAESFDPDIEALPLQAMIGGILHKERIPSALYKVGNGQKLQFILDSPVGDNNNFDLFVKRGQLPSTSNFDYKSVRTDNNEKIEVLKPAAGDYYIMINSTRGSGGYNLKVVLT